MMPATCVAEDRQSAQRSLLASTTRRRAPATHVPSDRKADHVIASTSRPLSLSLCSISYARPDHRFALHSLRRIISHLSSLCSDLLPLPAAAAAAAVPHVDRRRRRHVCTRRHSPVRTIARALNLSLSLSRLSLALLAALSPADLVHSPRVRDRTSSATGDSTRRLALHTGLLLLDAPRVPVRR